MEQRFGFGDILGEARRMMADNGQFLAGVTALIAVGYAALDLITQADASSIPSLIVSIFVQYLVVERLLAGRIQDPGNRRYGALFIAGLLGGLGMLLGFVFFIIPGVMLAASWSASSAFVVADRMSGTEALGASWRATSAARWSIVGVMAATYLPFLVIFIVAMGAVGAAQGSGLIDPNALEGPAIIIVTDVLVAVLGTWGWVLGAAIYNLAVPVSDGLAEVFG